MRGVPEHVEEPDDPREERVELTLLGDEQADVLHDLVKVAAPPIDRVALRRGAVGRDVDLLDLRAEQPLGELGRQVVQV